MASQASEGFSITSAMRGGGMLGGLGDGKFIRSEHPFEYAVSKDAVAWPEAHNAAQRTADEHDCLSGDVPECPRDWHTGQKKVYDTFVEDSLRKAMTAAGVDRVWIATWAKIKDGRPDESTRITPAVLVRTAGGWQAEKPGSTEKARVGVALYDKRAELKGTPDPSLAHRVTADYHGSATGYTMAEGQEDYRREG